jgi:hypothetical protein
MSGFTGKLLLENNLALTKSKSDFEIKNVFLSELNEPATLFFTKI